MFKIVVQKNPSERKKWNVRTDSLNTNVSKFLGLKNDSSDQPKNKIRALWGPKMTLQNCLNYKLESILWPSVEILGSKNDPSEQPKSIPKANSLTPCQKFVVQKNQSERSKSNIRADSLNPCPNLWVQKITLQNSINKMLEPFGVLKWPFRTA